VSLKKLSFAKVNLFLYVTGTRDDGYHELNSLMAQIDLCDELEFGFEEQGIRVLCDHPQVPEGKENLAFRAAELFFLAYKKQKEAKKGKLPIKGVCIHIKKKIPVGGGLGGGSSNAATVLMTLNEQCSNPFSPGELMELGLQLGADVPFFIFGSPALATGVGETLETYSDLPELYLVLCDPGVFASTREVFKNIDFRLTSGQDYNMNTGLNALAGGSWTVRGEKLHNDLEGSACDLYPEIGSAKDEMAFLLQQDVYMSGSGSSLFALFAGPDTAKKAYGLLAEKWSRGTKNIFLASLKR
jgi:4-diphosphocytidyl-2-C-methyl-D-erythritol kinase